MTRNSKDAVSMVLIVGTLAAIVLAAYFTHKTPTKTAVPAIVPTLDQVAAYCAANNMKVTATKSDQDSGREQGSVISQDAGFMVCEDDAGRGLAVQLMVVRKSPAPGMIDLDNSTDSDGEPELLEAPLPTHVM